MVDKYSHRKYIVQILDPYANIKLNEKKHVSCLKDDDEKLLGTITPPTHL